MTAISGTTSTTLTTTTFTEVAKDLTLGMADKVLSMGSHLYDMAKTSVHTYPYVIPTTAAALLAGYFFFLHSKKTPPPSSLHLVKAVELCIERKNYQGTQPVIAEFVSKLFQSTDFQKKVGSTGTNAHTVRYLQEKITKIAEDSEIDPLSMVEIVDNVVNNFANELSKAQSRTYSDMETGNLKYLGIETTDKITQIQPLGDETHNKGKIPLRILLESGKSIVYKPRSMTPEKMICDPNEGVLRYEEFGTYRVVCRQDKNEEEYGYSDFIQNTEAQNTVSNPQELKEYVRKILVLEKVAKSLGLSDLHYFNIITENLSPCIIDAEVFLNPPEMDSGLLSKSNGPLYVFDIMSGYDKAFQGKNKVWFEPAFASKYKSDFRFGISSQAFEDLQINVEKMKDSTELSEKTLFAIEEARTLLEQSHGRFVLKETPHLTAMQLTMDHHSEKSIRIFIESIEEWVNALDFQFQPQAENAIREGVIEDARHHDIPAFYYNSEKEEVLYHGAVIGMRPARV